jgi:hypothetical protein
LHILSSKGHARDDALAGNERTGDNANEEASFETEHYAPSSDGSDLGDQMDRLLNGGMPLSRDHGYNNDNTYEDGSTLVDYNGDESEDNSARSDDGFKVDMTEHVDCLAQEDEQGDEQSATHGTGDNSSEVQPSLEQPPSSAQATPQEIRHDNVVNQVNQLTNITNLC